MKDICNKSSCTGCGACVGACPKKCIRMEENSEGFRYPVIDESACVDCGLCAKVCPVNTCPEKREGDFYMCWNRDRETLLKSASGGAFSAIAGSILRKGGVVWGACQDFAERRVYHALAENEAELENLRRSKYCQSDMTDVYVRTKEFLRAGRPVLFSGTACQAAGLIGYLTQTGMKEKLPLLWTVDVLCHGVASQKTVDAYLASKERKYKKKITKYYFRYKTEKSGWLSVVLHLFFEDGTHYAAPRGMDTFFFGFNRNLFLRNSCYECRFCGTERVCDFTIADYWGVPEERVTKQQLHDGISVITVNTEKARALLPELETAMEMTRLEDPSIAIANNSSFKKPYSKPAQRDAYFRAIETEDFDKIINRTYRKVIFKAHIKNFIGIDNFKRIKRLLKRG